MKKCDMCGGDIAGDSYSLTSEDSMTACEECYLIDLNIVDDNALEDIAEQDTIDHLRYEGLI